MKNEGERRSKGVEESGVGLAFLRECRRVGALVA